MSKKKYEEKGKDESREMSGADKSTNGTRKDDSNGRRRGRGGRGSGRTTNPPRVSGINDPSWYRAIPQMVVDAASISFSNAMGANIPSNGVFRQDHQSIEQDVLDVATPGIMTLGYVPGVGLSIDSSSPINIVGAANYAYVRHANSGARNWTQNDGTLYLVAAANLYAAWAYVARLLGVMNKYDVYNRYIGDALITSMGFNPIDMRSHQADLRAFLNTFAFKLGSICFPSGMTYIQRQVQLAGNIYLDANGVKAQMYLFKPECFYTYSEVENEAGSMLKPVTLGSTYAGLVSGLTTLINNFLESESVMTISGDMMKAYNNEVMHVGTIDENYNIEFKSVEEVLTQIENYKSIGYLDQEHTHDLGDFNDVPSCYILADNNTNTVLYQPRLQANQITADGTYLPTEEKGFYLNMPMDNPTSDDVMVATRMAPIFRFEGNGESYPSAIPITIGSELPTHATLWYFNSTRDLESDPYISTYMDVNSSRTDIPIGRVSGTYKRMGQITSFRAHPLIMVVNTADAIETDRIGFDFLSMMGDIKNLTYVEKTVYEKANTAALFSEFYNPALGAFLKTNP